MWYLYSLYDMTEFDATFLHKYLLYFLMFHIKIVSIFIVTNVPVFQ